MTSNKVSWYDKYCKLTKSVNEILCIICVLALAVELMSVSVMVVGRYVFNYVPQWTEQMSLMALAWMSIISIAMGLYKEDHMRVEIFDKVFPAKFVTFLKYASNVTIIVFSALMIKYGIVLVNLTKKILLSGFRVSTGLMYFPLIVCGVSSIYMSVFCMVRRYMEEKK